MLIRCTFLDGRQQETLAETLCGHTLLILEITSLSRSRTCDRAVSTCEPNCGLFHSGCTLKALQCFGFQLLHSTRPAGPSDSALQEDARG